MRLVHGTVANPRTVINFDTVQHVLTLAKMSKSNHTTKHTAFKPHSLWASHQHTGLSGFSLISNLQNHTFILVLVRGLLCTFSNL